jgi:mono/diheme cytochrome c family protein
MPQDLFGRVAAGLHPTGYTWPRSHGRLIMMRVAMSTFPTRLLAALVFAGAAVLAIDVHAHNIERGRQLYENHCQTCHTAQVHGRKNRTAMSVGDLRDIVDRWQRNQKLNWSREDIEDVVQYLSTTRYFFVSEAQ